MRFSQCFFQIISVFYQIISVFYYILLKFYEIISEIITVVDFEKEKFFFFMFCIFVLLFISIFSSIFLKLKFLIWPVCIIVYKCEIVQS